MSAHRRTPRRARQWRALALAASLVLTVSTGVLALVGGGPLLAGQPAAQAGFSARVDPGGGIAKVPPAEVDRQVAEPAVPARSGQGRRVVFDEAAQQVWLVGANDTVVDTYPVSGSVTDNLEPGRYRVYSRSRHATSFDYESTMRFFVRFTEGKNAAIGFHDIPVDDEGRPLQAVSELGTPQSHGCIRQASPDAKQMWAFARIDTPVVVL